MPEVSDVRVELKNEIVISGKSARVLVYHGDELVATVVADTELQQGADSGYYHAVVLKKE